MKEIAKTPNLVEEISNFEPFKGIDQKVLEWLVEKSTYNLYEEGDMLIYSGMLVEHMQIIIDGQYRFFLTRNNETKMLGIGNGGEVTGILPFSRMKTTSGNSVCLEPTRVLKLHKRHFVEMVNVSYELTQNLVATMTDRVRNFTHIQYQNEKLMSLGKLSAGLAHELNNPASAMVRSADELYKKIHATPEKFKNIIAMRITEEQTDGINDVLFAKAANWKDLEELPMMEREERLDEILDWLDDKEVEESDDLAETFVDFDLDIDDLEKIEDILDGQHLDGVLGWMESTLNLEKLVDEIRESADRIADLIGSIKSYSHMDKGVDFEATDVHKGIMSTMVMLKHKFKKKNIQVVKEKDPNLPTINAFPSELNQIWTNIIDNALDAMEHGGTLTIRSKTLAHGIEIQIEDNGSGIPEEVLNKIYDPFFTTKAMGEGTGLGLDIVRKIINHHKGDIRVESQPGKTVFTLTFPF